MRRKKNNGKMIPGDLICDEILGWLPVKSLLRFKSVCKQWNILISSVDFAKHHLKRQLLCTTPNVLIQTATYRDDGNLFMDKLLSLKLESCFLLSKLDYSSHEQKTGVIIGSCNGLICIMQKTGPGFTEKFLVWNPATQQQLYFQRLEGVVYVRLYIGFGYHSSFDDYKIVILAENRDLRVSFMYNTKMSTSRTRKRKRTKISTDNQVTSMEICSTWLQLPDDVTLTILMKLGCFQILQSAQFVCKSWYNLCKQPCMWHTIHIDNFDKPTLDVKYEKMTCNAVDRSAGGLIDLDIEGFGSNELCSYVASRSSQLKRLRLASCKNITVKALMGALEKLSSLEELELTLCKFRGKKTVPIINSCPSVTTFKLNNVHPNVKCDEEALAIARCMHELRHLQLIGNNMTYDGLTAILDGCGRLQSLDLRRCYNLSNAQKLDKRLSANIKDLRRPFDSIKEFSLQRLVNAAKRSHIFNLDGNYYDYYRRGPWPFYDHDYMYYRDHDNWHRTFTRTMQ